VASEERDREKCECKREKREKKERKERKERRERERERECVIEKRESEREKVKPASQSLSVHYRDNACWSFTIFFPSEKVRRFP